jgi:hypothetical protein
MNKINGTSVTKENIIKTYECVKALITGGVVDQVIIRSKGSIQIKLQGIENEYFNYSSINNSNILVGIAVCDSNNKDNFQFCLPLFEDTGYQCKNSLTSYERSNKPYEEYIENCPAAERESIKDQRQRFLDRCEKFQLYFNNWDNVLESELRFACGFTQRSDQKAAI